MSKALLIVHGIGEQLRGETTEKLVSGFTAAFGDGLHVQRDGNGFATAVTARGVTVAFHEAYWANLLTREANRGTLTWSTMPTLVWQPMLCRRAKLLQDSEYPAWLVGGWLLLTLPASLLSYPVAQGARVFAQMYDQEREARIQARVKALPWLQKAKAVADAAAHDDTLVEAALEGVVADVPSYMSSVARGEGVAFEVLARFHDAMRAAREQHDEVYVLAHSLGTVVAYHALTGMGQPAGEPPYAPRRLITIGSPLEKIRFFWPWTVRRTAPSVHPEFRWTNFYHRMDPVSGALKRFAAWAPIENLRLKGGGGVLRSHVVYERSPEFLGMLTEELFGERAVPSVPWWRRLGDRVMTVGENLLGPLALIVSLALGLAFIAILLLVFPYLFSLPLRLFGMDVWAGRLADGLSLLVLLSMTIVLAGKLRECYRTACASVAAGATRSGAPSDSRTLSV